MKMRAVLRIHDGALISMLSCYPSLLDSATSSPPKLRTSLSISSPTLYSCTRHALSPFPIPYGQHYQGYGYRKIEAYVWRHDQFRSWSCIVRGCEEAHSEKSLRLSVLHLVCMYINTCNNLTSEGFNLEDTRQIACLPRQRMKEDIQE